MAKTITIKKAQDELPNMIKKARKRPAKYVITDNGIAFSLDITPIEDEYTSESEINEILADKKLMKDIKIAEKELEEGKYVTLEQLRKELNF